MLAEKVHSSGIESSKEKSAWLKLASVTDNITEILDELIDANKESKLSADRLIVNNFTTTIEDDTRSINSDLRINESNDKN